VHVLGHGYDSGEGGTTTSDADSALVAINVAPFECADFADFEAGAVEQSEEDDFTQVGCAGEQRSGLLLGDDAGEGVGRGGGAGW
jgi:hypothetical protein